MPSRNSKSNYNDKESYMYCLDPLEEEILNIYNGSHALVTVGDMNALLAYGWAIYKTYFCVILWTPVPYAGGKMVRKPFSSQQSR